MNEATLWRYLRNGLRPLRVDLQRHEDIAGVGIPDVSYGARGVNGWIELKYVRSWRRDGTVRVPWRPGQREWLIQRGRVGGRCWLLIRVARSNYLFDHRNLPPQRECWARAEEYQLRSAFSWETGVDEWSVLSNILTSERKEEQ